MEATIPKIKITSADESIKMESLTRISGYSVVQNAMKLVNGMYTKVKESHAAVRWGFQTAETLFHGAVQMVQPVAEKPITAVDSLLCKGLDVVEGQISETRAPKGSSQTHSQRQQTKTDSSLKALWHVFVHYALLAFNYVYTLIKPKVQSATAYVESVLLPSVKVVPIEGKPIPISSTNQHAERKKTT